MEVPCLFSFFLKHAQPAGVGFKIEFKTIERKENEISLNFWGVNTFSSNTLKNSKKIISQWVRLLTDGSLPDESYTKGNNKIANHIKSQYLKYHKEKVFRKVFCNVDFKTIT